MPSFVDDSGLIIGEEYQLEYSRRRGTWFLRHPSDKRRAWKSGSLLSLVAAVTGEPMRYRYGIASHDAADGQPNARTFEGVLLAVAAHPREFSIPGEFEGDYSQQELATLRRWQELLIAGTASQNKPPLDVDGMSFADAMGLVAAAPSRGGTRQE